MLGILNCIPYQSPIFASLVVLAKNVEISNSKLAQFCEAIFNGCGKASEFLIAEGNFELNIQYYEQRVEIIYYFGGEVSRPVCKRP